MNKLLFLNLLTKPRNMRLELTTLQEWIHQSMANSKSNLTENFSSLLSLEKERIKQAWLNVLLAEKDIVQQKRYMQSHQYELARIFELAYNESGVPPIMLSTIKDLYLFLEQHVDYLLDFHYPTPALLTGALLDDGRLPWAGYAERFQNITPSLLQIAIRPLQQMERLQPLQKIPFGMLIALKQYTTVISTLLVLHDEIEDDDLLAALISVNFQDVDVLEYFKMKVIADLEKATDTSDKMNQLQLLVIRIKSISVTTLPGQALHLQQSLLQWLEQEMADLQKEIDEWNMLDVDNDDDLGRLETSLNVKELGLMIRLSFFAAVFVNRDVKKLIKLMSFRVATVATGERKNISAKAIWNAMYRYEDSTLLTVERILMRMFEQFQLLKKRELERRGIRFKKLPKEVQVIVPLNERGFPLY